MIIRPVAHLRVMRGGAQAHLVRADDGHSYVVKFLNNPQHRRILANEWLGTKIAAAVGLSVPEVAVMDVGPEFIAQNSMLAIRTFAHTVPCCPGPALASRLPVDEPEIPISDYLPDAALETVENLPEFAGILALDKWLCNCDGRQAVFFRPKAHGPYRACFIDFGFCFSAGDWDFPDSPLRGVYPGNLVYRDVTGWESFEPWLSRIEAFPEAVLHEIASGMSRKWAPKRKRVLRLLEEILARRARVRELVRQVHLRSRAPFRNWHGDSLAISA